MNDKRERKHVAPSTLGDSPGFDLHRLYRNRYLPQLRVRASHTHGQAPDRDVSATAEPNPKWDTLFDRLTELNTLIRTAVEDPDPKPIKYAVAYYKPNPRSPDTQPDGYTITLTHVEYADPRHTTADWRPVPGRIGDDMNIIYKVDGIKVRESDFRAIAPYYAIPKKDVGDGSDDDFPEVLKAQIKETRLERHMAIICHLEMIDGAVPTNYSQYRLNIFFGGTKFELPFELKWVNGVETATAEHIMGQEGWFRDPKEQPGNEWLWISRSGGELHSEALRGLGWFDDHRHCCHTFCMEYGQEPPPPPPPTTHTITVSASPLDWGVVTSDEPLVDIPHGEPRTLYAEPAATKRFLQWTGAVDSTENPLYLSAVTEDMYLQAHFVDQDQPPPEPDVEAAIAHLLQADAEADAGKAEIAAALEDLRYEKPA